MFNVLSHNLFYGKVAFVSGPFLAQIARSIVNFSAKLRRASFVVSVRQDNSRNRTIMGATWPGEPEPRSSLAMRKLRKPGH